MIAGTTRLAAVLGWPIAHSRSPPMLNAAFAAAGIDAAIVPLAVCAELMTGNRQIERRIRKRATR